MKIRSTFYDSERMNPIDMIRLDKIKILGCEGHADSSYIETIEMSFNVCSKTGSSSVQILITDLGLSLILKRAIFPKMRLKNN